MGQPATGRISFAEYLDSERAGDVKHEWLDGVVIAMAGGTRLHALLHARVLTSLAAAVRPEGCDVYGSDLMVRIPETGMATYPDVSVVCGEFVGDVDNPEAATNPVVLVEVLSPGTESWDRGGKFAHYQRLASLQEYVLVSQERQWVEWFVRQPDGTWSYRCAGPAAHLDLASLGVRVAVADLYAGTGVPIRDNPPMRVGAPHPDWGKPAPRPPP